MSTARRTLERVARGEQRFREKCVVNKLAREHGRKCVRKKGSGVRRLEKATQCRRRADWR